LIAGTLASAADVDELWFAGQERHVYAIAVDGNVSVSLHAPAHFDPATGDLPGTSAVDDPLFRYSGAWRHDMPVVAPHAGLYRLHVVRDGDRPRTNYTVRIYESAWIEPDLPSIREWGGTAVSCGVP
jgi:hypothetical protein